MRALTDPLHQPSIFLCLISVVADIYSRHMHVNDVASQHTLGLYCHSEVSAACVFAALVVLARAMLRLQLYHICCSTPPPLALLVYAKHQTQAVYEVLAQQVAGVGRHKHLQLQQRGLGRDRVACLGLNKSLQWTWKALSLLPLSF